MRRTALTGRPGAGGRGHPRRARRAAAAAAAAPPRRAGAPRAAAADAGRRASPVPAPQVAFFITYLWALALYLYSLSLHARK
jgi:hypothetical protein